ncbi:MAG: HEAT repeat domain-containing protein, partial [Gemmataceae bacterium]
MRRALAMGLLLCGPMTAFAQFRFFESKAEAVTTPEQTDTKALAAVKLKPADTPGLLAYFRQRTLSDTDLVKIRAIIQKMTDESFDVRESAAGELSKFGVSAIGPLRAAQTDVDPEVGYRSGEVLKRIEKEVSHTAVALAAARALAKSRPPEAVPVLLGYLPVADSSTVEEAIRKALISMAVKENQPDPALLKAVTDPLPIRRSAAIVALIEGGNTKERIRVPNAYEQVRKQVLAETDTETKFRGLYSLLTVAREPLAVAPLIDMIPQSGRGRVWQIEDYLVQLAGSSAPKTKFGATSESLKKATADWQQWWTKSQPTKKLDAFDYQPKTTGCLLLTLMDRQGWGNAQIREIGPDGKERWKLGGIQAPCEVKVLPNGNLLILEQNYSRLTERDLSGKILLTRALSGPPTGFQLLPNGNTLVVYRHMIQEHDKDWKVIFTYNRANQDILSAHRMKSGVTLVLCQNNSGIFRVDEKGKELPDPIKTGPIYWQSRLE